MDDEFHLTSITESGALRICQAVLLDVLTKINSRHRMGKNNIYARHLKLIELDQWLDDPTNIWVNEWCEAFDVDEAKFIKHFKRRIELAREWLKDLEAGL